MNSSVILSSSASLTPARTWGRSRTSARATSSPARLKPLISSLLRSTTMGASYRSTNWLHQRAVEPVDLTRLDHAVHRDLSHPPRPRLFGLDLLWRLLEDPEPPRERPVATRRRRLR